MEGLQLEDHPTSESQVNCGCRHARDGSVTSMFGTSAYQYNPRHSAAPSEMPRGIKMEPHSESAVATVPQTDDLVKLGKRKAWAKFLAYEVSTNVRCVYVYLTRKSIGQIPFISNKSNSHNSLNMYMVGPYC